jgi:hypothetical protein
LEVSGAFKVEGASVVEETRENERNLREEELERRTRARDKFGGKGEVSEVEEERDAEKLKGKEQRVLWGRVQ